MDVVKVYASMGPEERESVRVQVSEDRARINRLLALYDEIDSFLDSGEESLLDEDGEVPPRRGPGRPRK